MATQEERTWPRLFVALWPSPEALDHLRAALAGRRSRDDALRWQPPERWHVTLAFLGQAEPDRTRNRLSRVTAPTPEPVRLAGAGTFGPVLWIGVEHGPWLPDLTRAVRRALHVDDSRNRPHLTVARARGAAAPARARGAVDALADYRGPTWTPEELTLVRSYTGPSPRYEMIGSWALPLAADAGD